MATFDLVSKYAVSLIEASLDPLVVINMAGKITDMNQALVKVTGSTREKLMGSDFKKYFTEPIEARKAYLEVFKRGFLADCPLVLKDHKLTYVLFNGSVFKNEKGVVAGAVIVARDVTEQRRIETELIEAKVFAELATEIAEAAKEKAEKAEKTALGALKAKQQFLSNMSHEIRTPMNAIIGFTKVILRTELSAKQTEYLNAIKLSGDALIVLINDILDLAKVDAGKMTFEKVPFKISASISSIMHLFEPKIQEKNIELVIDFDPKIPQFLLGDSVRLHQIIINLLGNAVKFTSEGFITFSTTLLEESETDVKLQFSVKDTGIGIEKDKLGSIFENFQQSSSSTTRLYGGTGLGLAIVKHLVEAQKGSVSVSSAIGEGSTFSFILNFEKANSLAELVSDIPEIDFAPKKVHALVVEDILLNQLLMKTLIDDFGFTCDFANNGKIALEMLEKSDYDIVLMDLQMPIMNGFEATENIRKVMFSDIPIMALTADVTTSDLERCKAVGIDDYIAKPIDEKLLHFKMMTLIKKSTWKKKQNVVENSKTPMTQYTNLTYLFQRTKSNPVLIAEVISAFLDQTPRLIGEMKQNLENQDWEALQLVMHKIVPSFSIVGINPDFETIARKIMDFARSKQQMEEINDMVSQLELVFNHAFLELNDELQSLNSLPK